MGKWERERREREATRYVARQLAFVVVALLLAGVLACAGLQFLPAPEVVGGKP